MVRSHLPPYGPFDPDSMDTAKRESQGKHRHHQNPKPQHTTSQDHNITAGGECKRRTITDNTTQHTSNVRGTNRPTREPYAGGCQFAGRPAADGASAPPPPPPPPPPAAAPRRLCGFTDCTSKCSYFGFGRFKPAIAAMNRPNLHVHDNDNKPSKRSVQTS